MKQKFEYTQKQKDEIIQALEGFMNPVCEGDAITSGIPVGQMELISTTHFMNWALYEMESRDWGEISRQLTTDFEPDTGHVKITTNTAAIFIQMISNLLSITGNVAMARLDMAKEMLLQEN